VKKTLRVYVKTNREPIMELSAEDGRVTFVRGDENMQQAFDRWLRRGFVDLHDKDGRGLDQRVTKSDDPMFLDIIAESLGAQFRLITIVETDP